MPRPELLGHETRPDEVRLLGVIGLGEGERPAGLGREQVHAVVAVGEQPSQIVALANVRGLDPGAAAFQRRELIALGRIPVVRERHPVAFVKGQLGESRAEIPRAEDEQRRQR